MRTRHDRTLRRALSCLLLTALLLALCGDILFSGHSCNDPACVICRVAEQRRLLAWALLSVPSAAIGADCLHSLGSRRLISRRNPFTLVSCCVQLND